MKLLLFWSSIALLMVYQSVGWCAGGVVMNWNESYGDWSNTRGNAYPANWYPTDGDGRVILKDLSPGFYTIGITRAFGLGPLVMPGVYVEDGKCTCLNMSFSTDYFARPGQESIQGKTILQPFIAKGDFIIKATAFFAKAPEPRKAKYTILRADGTQIGPEGARPPSTNSFVGTWNHGSVPVMPGSLYYLRIDGGQGKVLDVKLASTDDPTKQVIVDGRIIPGKCLAGFVQSDQAGICSTRVSVEGVFHPKPERMVISEDAGQTFIARGTGLAMVDFHPLVPGVEGEVEFDVVVRAGDTNALKISEKRVRGPNGAVLQAVWQPGEVMLQPGRLYCIDIRNPSGKPFKLAYVPADTTSLGVMYIDGKSVPAFADMNIVEYDADSTPPSPPYVEVLSGDGFARIHYKAPADIDVRKLQIRYVPANANESWPLNPAQDYLMAEINVLPGQYGAICHTGLQNFAPYTYAVYAVDFNGNYSKPARAGAWPGKGPVLPAQATVLNPGFLVTRGIGACPEGWDIRVDEGNPDWQTFVDTDGTRSFGWKSSTDTKASLTQVVALTPGRKYKLAVKVKGTSANSAVSVEDVVSDSGPLTGNWSVVNLTLTAKRVETAVTISGIVKGEGEVRFADFQIWDITAL